MSKEKKKYILYNTIKEEEQKMEKFWEWMSEKRRVSTHELSYVDTTSFVIHKNGVIYKGEDTEYNRLPKQMLIGYMVEYLIEKSSENNILFKDVDDVYDSAVKEVENIK